MLLFSFPYSSSFNLCFLRQIPICCSIFVFKLYHKTCEQFYRNFGIYEKSPNSFLPGLPRSIINQFRFHNLLCLCLASVHLPHPFHLIIGFQFLGHAVSLRQLRHDQLHAVSCRFVNLSAILSYVRPAIARVVFLFFEHAPFSFFTVSSSHGLYAEGGGFFRKAVFQDIPHKVPQCFRFREKSVLSVFCLFHIVAFRAFRQARSRPL